MIGRIKKALLCGPKPLFDPSLVYPTDDVGCYVELIGEVVSVDDQDDPDDEVRVDVRTDWGTFDGYTVHPPKVGYTATVRVYDAGGGFYPDNRIVAWSAPR